MYDVTNTVRLIKETAKEKGISTTKMFEDIELNKNTLSSMSKRGSWISSDGLAKIADYLGVSVDYLLGRKQQIENKKSAPDDVIRDTIIEKLNDMDDRQLARLQGYLEGLAAAAEEE